MIATRSNEKATEPSEITAIARACFQCHVEKDGAKIKTLISDDFHFTSPLHNRLDRASYFQVCWPNSADTEGFDFVHLIEHGDQVFVTYEGQSRQSRFRNTEILTVRDGKIFEVEVYFGWNVPQEVPRGEHRDPK